MSVEPWIDAWPRSAMIPPPGRPMFPSRSWMIAAVRIDLDAHRVLRPADRVDERAGALATRAIAQRLGDVQELLDAAATCVGDELRRVARVVTPQNLEDAAGMLQGVVGLRRSRRVTVPPP